MKRYTIAEIEEQASNAPIWALNGSAEVYAAADIIISIPKLNGAKVDSLRIPATWLPVALTEQISRSQLLAATEFRQAVTRGTVILIDAETAASLAQNDGADEERARLREMEIRVRDAMASRGIHTDDVSIVAGETSSEAPATDLDPAFVIFFESLQLKNDVESMNSMRTRGRFRRSEAEYMARHLVDKPKSLEFVRTLLSR